ncbi:MAG TPA: DUF502 domain-containing protein [Phycisphaerae bacterium]|nr:DUF502 domain-containing protein [Phycisphaerae bacterium]
MNTPPPQLSSGPTAARSPAPVADSSAADMPQQKPLRERSPILAHVRRALFTGLLTAIPLFITIYIISILYGFATKFTQNSANSIVDHLFGKSTTGEPPSAFTGFLKSSTSAGFAIAIAILIVYILGLLGSFFIGRQILAQIEHFIGNLPLIKGIYGTTKQVMAVFRQGGGGAGFQRVVLVEFPRQGTWTLAFVTNTVHDAQLGKLICCFIPMTPNPTSGFFQMFPEDQVRSTDWSVDMGIKIVLSGGLLAPRELTHPEESAVKKG